MTTYLNNDVSVTRSEIYELLGDKALDFVDWLMTDNVHAKRIDYLMHTIEVLNLNSPVFNTYIKPVLQAEGIYTAEVDARVQQRIEINTPKFE